MGRILPSALKMEAAHFTKTSVTIHQTAQKTVIVRVTAVTLNLRYTTEELLDRKVAAPV
jgi:hypothetical protein